MGFGGIIAGAIGGAGQGLSDIAKDQQQVDLVNIASNLALEKEKSLMQYKQNMAIQDQQRTAGIIQKGASDIADQRLAPQAGAIQDGITNPDYGPPGTQDVVDQKMASQKAKLTSNYGVQAQAAANAGLLGEAATLQKMEEAGATTVPWGSARVKNDGSVLYDNGTAIKASVNQQLADAKTTAAEARAASAGRGPKPMDPVKVAQTAETMVKGISMPPNPFADMGAAKEDKIDTAGRDTLRAMFAKRMEEAGDDGSYTAVASKAKADYNGYESKVNTAARRFVSDTYKNGKYDGDDKAAEQIQAQFGIDPRTAAPNQLGDAARTKWLQNWDAYLSGQTQVMPAPAAAPAATAATPATVSPLAAPTGGQPGFRSRAPGMEDRSILGSIFKPTATQSQTSPDSQKLIDALRDVPVGYLN